MKIHPPKAIIDNKDPFAQALFGRKEFAESLTRLLRIVSENLVIFVNAPWGEGKTTFAQMWRAHLQQQKLEVIYFDSYAADYFDDPFVSFSGEILGLVDKHLSNGKGLIERREFKETAVEVGKRLAGLAVKVGLRAATLSAVEAGDLKEFKEIATGVSEIGADVIERKIENYTVEKDALKKFKHSLAKLAAKVREEQGFPLVIIVDELDRCRPDFALGLLERIKHLFDVDGVAFVLLVNRDQIQGYIEAVYGSEDARGYLLKFGNLFVNLPVRQPLFSSEYVKGRKDYCQMLFAHYAFPVRYMEDGFLASSIAMLTGQFDLTLREVERAFAIMALYYGSLPNNELTDAFLISMLSILKVKLPTLYHLLATERMPVDRFLRETGLEQFKNEGVQGVDQSWVKDMLNFCLMSDIEFEKATEGEEKAQVGRSGLRQLGSWLVRYRIHRNKVIPCLCSRLDRFSLRS